MFERPKLKRIKLSQALRTKDGATFKTMEDVAVYMVGMSEHRQSHRLCQHVLELVERQADSEALTKQATFALHMGGHRKP